MIIAITENDCRVAEAEDCGRLHATADGLTDAEAGAALERAGLGRGGESQHVWLAIDALRTAARGSAETPDWDVEFEAMLAYAGSKGWLDPSRRHVAAHLDRGRTIP